MASRLNHLFQIAPQSYLERTVLFSNDFLSPESYQIMEGRTVHSVDIEPVTTRTRLRVLPSFHQYADQPMFSYVIPLEGVTMVPKDDPPQRLVFIPEFTCGRLLVQDDQALLRFSVERDLLKMLPPPEQEPGSRFCDSINYWEFWTKDLVGNIRATALLYKELNKSWRFMMQQIVGPPGAEVVCKLITRDLRYPRTRTSC